MRDDDVGMREEGEEGLIGVGVGVLGFDPPYCGSVGVGVGVL